MTSAVLLPLRLETRFQGRRLRIRVIPDEPWYDRHDPLPSAAELTGLDRYLSVASPDAGSPDAREAWRVFAGQIGPGRAAWLVRTFPVGAPRPDRLRDSLRFAKIASFPERLEVWLAHRGRSPVRAATLTVDPARLRLDPSDPGDDDDQRWWESWEEAVRAGLATELTLPADAGALDALYVVGLGSATPADLFASHRDAGRLGLIPPGTPTNAVDGQPAADLGQDPMPWLDLFGRNAATPERQVSLTLTGDPDLLGPLPGDRDPYQRRARQALTGLWPALVGHTLAHVLGLGVDAVDRAAAWAEDNVDPLGPFPTVRIGNQPYGLLPVTSLAAWVPTESSPTIESDLRPAIIGLRRRWASAALRGGRGAIENASPEQLLDLLGQPPASPGYALRMMHPLELWQLALLATGHSVGWPELVRAWQQRYPIAAELQLRPRRRYSSRGSTHRLKLPLVTPRALGAAESTGTVLRRMVDLARDSPASFRATSLVEDLLGSPVDSLLLRLAIRSLQVTLGNLGQVKAGSRPIALQPVAVRAGESPLLSDWIGTLEPEDLLDDNDRARASARMMGALRALSGVPAAQLERILPATVDCATHRIDPWVVAYARRRLRQLAGQPPRLGAYGWVDRPGPGSPGPTAGGLVLAPSQTQALVSALIRDRAVSDPEPGRWEMDVTSQRVRGAAHLADEVRRGAHPAEALGREVERLVADPQRIRDLRVRFPLRTEHAGRRTCDGLRVLAADPGSLGLPATALTDLTQLRAAIDVYGDLLVADAVHHVVEGRAGSAVAALDAAAGLARPPVLDVLETRREGRAVYTSCLLIIRDVPPLGLPADAATASPSQLADPAAAALVAARTGAAPDWRWQLTVTGGAQTEVDLSDLGLHPADALALPLGVLERLVREAADPDAVIADRNGSLRYERAVRLVALLGKTPATPADTVETTTVPPATTTDVRDRLTGLLAAAEALADRLDGVVGATDRRAALRLATRWGIAPEPDTAAADPPAEQVKQARQLLLDRLAAAPTETAADGLDVADLAAAISALASASGQIAVLGRLRRDALPGLTAANPGGSLDSLWLAQVAPVRPALARLEAFQLSAGTVAGNGPPLTAWTNRAGDPWQVDPNDSHRLVAVYAPRGLNLAGAGPGGQTVAAALIDRFAETIPSAEHTATAAFGFDAPGARAPQAILLAVPPDPGRPLDETTLVDILAETRELARARMVTLPDLEEITGLAPLPLVPAGGDVASRLER